MVLKCFNGLVDELAVWQGVLFEPVACVAIETVALKHRWLIGIVGGVVVVVVDAVGVVAAVVVGVGVCARPLLLFSLSSEPSSSLFSCWYISSTMGFHNRTRALMNQFETYKHIETSTLANIAVIFNLDFKKDPVLALDHCAINIESSDIPKAIRNK